MKKILRHCLWLLTVFAFAAMVRAEPVSDSTIRYTFDEADGMIAHDAGPLKVEATFSTLEQTSVEDAGLIVGLADQWQPILRNGVQAKHIKPDSEQLLLDTEAPSIFHRESDYSIDYEKGILKPFSGGRMQPNQRVVIGLTYRNEGPTRVPGHAGKAVQFNGKDAFIDCGEPAGLADVSTLTIDLWLQLPPPGAEGKEWNKTGLLLTKGEGLSLGFDKGKLVFKHAGLSASGTSSAAPVEIASASGGTSGGAPGGWHHLVASYAGGSVTVKLDDREVARTDKVTGRLRAEGPLRLGGTTDPHFFAGSMDDLVITFRN